METSAIIGPEWDCVLSLLPADLEESAVARLGLIRRREIRSAADLLRMALCYALCDFSLSQTAAWASLVGIGSLSAMAVHKRLVRAEGWLAHLVVEWLRDHGLAEDVPSVGVRIVDATVICAPGSRGTDWRVHLGLDLQQLRISTVELTGPEGGETFLRHQIPPGQIALADRGYGHREGVADVLRNGAHVVVRIASQNFPLQTSTGGVLDFPDCLGILDIGEVGDWPVQFQAYKQLWPMRLIALRKTQAACEKEQTRLRHEARRKGRQPDPRSLKAAHFVSVITDLPATDLPATQALELYRLRWQIELFFKRLKSILNIDHLRAKGEALARTYLYAKLLGALILDELCHQALSFSPWGYPTASTRDQPLEAHQAHTRSTMR